MTRATVHVRSSVGDSQSRPPKQLLERTAKLLRDEGFNINRIGRFGVSVTADENDFERVLGVDVKSNPASAAVQPKQKELSELVDSMQVDSEPEYFGTPLHQR